MNRIAFIAALLALVISLTARYNGQGSFYVPGQIFTAAIGNPPTPCANGNLYIDYGPTPNISVCDSNVWQGIVPSGTIILIDAGACPLRYDELDNIDGFIPQFTTTANGNVGTTDSGPSPTGGTKAYRMIACKRQ